MNDDLLTTQAAASYRPTPAYIGASWVALGIGAISFLIGLWNASTMLPSEKGFYLAVLALGLYSAVSLQKVIRDKAEGIKTSDLYYGISWAALGLSILLLAVGLWRAESLQLNERGFYLMAFTLSLFAVITIQKNTRDLARFNAMYAPQTLGDTIADGDEVKEAKSLFSSITSDKTT